MSSYQHCDEQQFQTTLQNPSFYQSFVDGTFPTTPQKGVCNEIFTTKETCPPP